MAWLLTSSLLNPIASRHREFLILEGCYLWVARNKPLVYNVTISSWKAWSCYHVFKVPRNKEKAQVSGRKSIQSKGESCQHSAVQRSQGSPKNVSVQPSPISNSFNGVSKVHLHTHSLTDKEPRKNHSVLPPTCNMLQVLFWFQTEASFERGEML